MYKVELKNQALFTTVSFRRYTLKAIVQILFCKRVCFLNKFNKRKIVLDNTFEVI